MGRQVDRWVLDAEVIGSGHGSYICLAGWVRSHTHMNVHIDFCRYLPSFDKLCLDVAKLLYMLLLDVLICYDNIRTSFSSIVIGILS